MRKNILSLIIFCSVFLNSCYDSENFLKRKENSIKHFTEAITQVNIQTGKFTEATNLVYPRNKAGFDILNNITDKDELKRPIITFICFYYFTDINSKVVEINWLALSSYADGIIIKQKGIQDLILNFNDYYINDNEMLSINFLHYTSYIEYDIDTDIENVNNIEIALVHNETIISAFHKIDMIKTGKSASSRDNK